MSLKLFYRVFIFECMMILSTLIFTSFTDLNTFDKKGILGTMISVISIIVAIIVTYLFSKLFSEKAIKIERKREIDKLSKKVTLLRRMAFEIRSMYEFWKFKNEHVNVNIKSTIEHKYKDLTYEQYRRYDLIDEKRLTDEEWDQIDNDIGSTDGQAYLALKALQDDENSYNMFREFHPQNYTLNDIERYREYAGSFWYFLDRSDHDVYNFNREKRYHLNKVDELYYKITNATIDQSDYRKSLKDLFSHFEEEIFQKSAYLLNRNLNTYKRFFKTSFLNMLFFLILLILSMIIYVVDISLKFDYICTLFLISVFISNTTDLLIITYDSIVIELDVTEIYEL